jgi:4-amino-4-deoxy-L-arabinose transferase-like glycosyltransferase
VAIGGVVLWRRRATYSASVLMALAMVATAVTAFVLLARTPDYLPWLKWVVVLVGLLTTALLAGVRLLPRRGAVAVAAAAIITALAAPAAYAVTTAGSPHTGSIVSAGPASAQGPFGRPGGMPGAFHPGMRPPGAMRVPQAGQPSQGAMPFRQGGTWRPSQGSSAGGLLQGSEPSSALTKLLETGASSYTWVAAAVGSNTAAGYQLATEQPVMPIGGFNGSDPSPTLAQFQRYVAAGKIHYFIAGGTRGGPGGFGAGGSTSSQITSWVEASFTARTVGGVTVYDLSGGVQ